MIKLKGMAHLNYKKIGTTVDSREEATVRKVHCTVDNGYGADKGIVCKDPGIDLLSTSIDKNITCKKCLKLLGMPLQDHGESLNRVQTELVVSPSPSLLPNRKQSGDKNE